MTEDSVLQKFSRPLKNVTEIRDSYVTTSCDLCEQMRKDLCPLQSYLDKHGYDSHRMRDAINILYQHKTEEKDKENFISSINICKYCAAKLRGNKEVARSFYNQLSVIPAPDCITCLNMFERALIKFCMTCITVVRLGQITVDHVMSSTRHSKVTLLTCLLICSQMLCSFQTIAERAKSRPASWQSTHSATPSLDIGCRLEESSRCTRVASHQQSALQRHSSVYTRRHRK